MESIYEPENGFGRVFAGLGFISCQCRGKGDDTAWCLCGPEERLVRGLANGTVTGALSERQRQWFYRHIDAANLPITGERQASDQRLAQILLAAWHRAIESDQRAHEDATP